MKNMRLATSGDSQSLLRKSVRSLVGILRQPFRGVLPRGAERGAAEPVHHCTGKQRSTGSRGCCNAHTIMSIQNNSLTDSHLPTDELSALRRRVAELEQALSTRDRHELALQQQTAEQNALLHAIPALVFYKDREHRYQIVNEAYAASYGLTVEAIQGKNDFEIHAPDIAAAYQANDEAVMASGEPRVNVELPIKLDDGTDGWLAEHNILHRNANGEVIGLVGVAIDYYRS